MIHLPHYIPVRCLCVGVKNFYRQPSEPILLALVADLVSEKGNAIGSVRPNRLRPPVCLFVHPFVSTVLFEPGDL